jgi:hypothetical protein
MRLGEAIVAVSGRSPLGGIIVETGTEHHGLLLLEVMVC